MLIYAVGSRGTILTSSVGGAIQEFTNRSSPTRFGLMGGENLWFDLSRQARVIIRLYDSRGKQSQRILDATQGAGQHVIPFPVTGPGVKILDFQAGGFRKAVKIH